MRINVHERDYIIIQIPNGNLHVAIDGDKTVISYYDHLEVTIEGKCKETPTVTIDSDEFPTHLIVKETEHKWIDEARLDKLEGE